MDKDRSALIRKDLNRGAAISFVGNIFKLMEFGLTLLGAGLFGVTVWGQYIFLNALFIPVVRFASAGMDKGLIWYLSRHRESRPPEGFFRWIHIRVLVMGLPVLAAVVGWTLFAGSREPEAKTLFDPLSFALVAGAAPFILLTNLNLGVSIAFRKIEHEVLVRGILHPALYLGLPCALAFISRDISLLAAAFLVGSVSGWVLSVRLARPLRRTLKDNPVTEDSGRAIKTLWAYSWPGGLRDVVLAVQQRTDIWCLALFLSPQAIGIYGLALSIANSIRTIRQAFDSILLAVVASLKRGADATNIRDAYVHAGQTTLALQIPIFAFLTFFADILLGLSGPEYAAGRIPLLIFAFTLILIGYMGLSGTVVMGLGKSRWGVFNDLLCLVLSLGFNFLLVPRHGIVGAALGTCLAILLTNIVWFLETVYLIRLVPLRAAVIVNFVFGVGFTAGTWILWRSLGGLGILSRAVYFALFAAAYAPLLWFLFGKRQQHSTVVKSRDTRDAGIPGPPGAA